MLSLYFVLRKQTHFSHRYIIHLLVIMSNNSITCITSVIDLSKLGRVLFVFKKSSIYPWLASIIQNQFQVDLLVSELIEPRLSNRNDKAIIYKTSDGNIKYYTKNPVIIEEAITDPLMKNSHNTKLSDLCKVMNIPNKTQQVPVKTDEESKLEHAYNVMENICLSMKKNVF